MDKDLYDKQAWMTRINTMTGNDPQRLAAFIPPAYADAENPLDAYADDMARKVRVSFPTQVMGRMIEKGEMPLEAGQPAAVGAFFKTPAPKISNLGKPRLINSSKRIPTCSTALLLIRSQPSLRA